ncbi:MAG: L-serine ammonia-lyase, iron-sulfur-dependent, subunit alpha [Eubacteriales bacterium]|nr:L-serine ammonia-lyase, iron-sulfur-dependent, subunit alpha [Eubacteriales bacterium]
MQVKDKKYMEYIQILKEELVPAMGCTEPIALAYAAAKAREVLGVLPKSCRIEVSGNIIKNVKSVIVPNTGGLKGIKAAVAAGIVAGDSSKRLEVVSTIEEKVKPLIKEYEETHEMELISYEGDLIFYISVTLFTDNSNTRVVIENYHTNITLVEKNGVVLFEAGKEVVENVGLSDRSMLNVKEIVEFAEIVEIDDIAEMIGRQIEYNSEIAQEGMTGSWGANIGNILIKTYGDDIKVRARAVAAAGSDARMSGCEKPVIILSGSGNQGLAASLPVIEYAKELQISQDKLYRAVALADLIAIHQKTSIGRLSAFCGAISAGCAAGAGIAYLCGGDYEAIAHTVVNGLAIVSGIVCDGAKPSCAAKIATAIDAGILGFSMYQNGQQFWGGDGIITKGVDNTIANVGRMASKGMRETDCEILKIMLEC